MFTSFCSKLIEETIQQIVCESPKICRRYYNKTFCSLFFRTQCSLKQRHWGPGTTVTVRILTFWGPGTLSSVSTGPRNGVPVRSGLLSPLRFSHFSAFDQQKKNDNQSHQTCFLNFKRHKIARRAHSAPKTWQTEREKRNGRKEGYNTKIKHPENKFLVTALHSNRDIFGPGPTHPKQPVDTRPCLCRSRRETRQVTGSARLCR